MKALKNYSLSLAVLAIGLLTPVLAFAEGEPIDVASIATDVLVFMSGAAIAGAGVFSFIYGLRMILRVFKIIK